jgi:pilus assembly protein CpaE
MNAPWSPSRAGAAQRDPFSAFVCDEQTAETLRAVCNEMGWQAEKVNKGGLRNAVQSLSVAASPSILIVDLSESGDPLSDVNSLAEVCEPGTIVIATGEVNDVRLYRDLVASGIQDYLLKPLNADQLRESLNQSLAAINAPKNKDGVNERPHMMAAVIGVRGGVGATSIATSLAWTISEKCQRSTALLDLDVHFGTGALALDLEPGRGLTDAIENPNRIDGLFIERAMVRASEKLSVLSTEAPISQPMLTDGTAFYQLQEEMQSAFECVVIDLPRNMLVQHPHLTNNVQAIVIVSEFTLAGARDMIRLLSWLKSNAPNAKIITVVNRVGAHSTPEITVKDFETAIECTVDFQLPFDGKTTSQSAKLGKSAAETSKSGKLGALLDNLANDVLATTYDDVDLGAGGKKKKGGFMAMFDKKPKEAKPSKSDAKTDEKSK